MKTMPQQLMDNVYLDRMISTLSTAFARLATLLAAIGLYGVLAYSIVQRPKEIGVMSVAAVTVAVVAIAAGAIPAARAAKIDPVTALRYE